MKSKYTKIMGIGLVATLLLSLLAFAVPTSAGVLFWDKVTLPSTSGFQLVTQSGQDIADMAVSGDTIYAAATRTEAIQIKVVTAVPADQGTTGFVVTYTDQDGVASTSANTTVTNASAADALIDVTLGGTDTGVFDVTAVAVASNNLTAGTTFASVRIVGKTSGTVLATLTQTAQTTGTFTDGAIVPGNTLYKSTDAGASWTDLGSVATYPSTKIVNRVRVAADSANVLVLTTFDNNVYYTDSGAATWTTVTGGALAGTINDIDVSVTTEGYRYLTAATSTPDLYTMKLAMGEVWVSSTKTGYLAQTNVLASRFSPGFASDKLIGVVSSNASSAYLQLYRLQTGALTWNNDITYLTGYGYGSGVSIRPGPSGSGIGGLTTIATRASIVFVPTAVGTSPDTLVAFVGLANASSEGGVYRVSTVSREVTTYSAGNVGPVNSVAYSAAGKLLAGMMGNTNVYTALTPLAGSPAFEQLNRYKSPGGQSKVVVAWSGTKAVAGTSGAESAFSVSTNDGKSFNDISLIDTALTSINAYKYSSDGKTLFVSTYTAAKNGSVWLLEGGKWMRVLSLRSGVNATTAGSGKISLSPLKDFKSIVIYLGSTQDIYTSVNSGKETWTYIPTYKVAAIKSFVVVNFDTWYMTDTTSVTKTTSGGAAWTDLVATGVTITGFSRISATGELVARTGDGYLAFSKDDGATWTKITNPVPSGGKVSFTTDPGYTKNGIIYAYTDVAGSSIYRGVLGKDMSWDLRGPTVDAAHKIQSMTFVGKVLYLFTNGGTTTTLYRALTPAADSVDLQYWSSTTTSPQLMKSLGKVGSTLYATRTDTAPDEIWSYGDPLATTAPTLTAPANRFAVPINDLTNEAFNVTFTFKRYASTYVTKLELQIATDSAFAAVVFDKVYDATTDTVAAVIGPTSSSDAAQFMPGQTYYWRVRTAANGPMYSPWSAGRSFTVASAAPKLIEIKAPALGSTGVGLLPMFAWTAVPKALAYEFQIATDDAFTKGGWKLVGSGSRGNEVKTNSYLSGHELEYNKTYWWRVRARTGSKVFGEWSVGIFTTMAEPKAVVPTAPPVTVITVTPPPAAPVVVPPMIPTYLLWTIVGIGAVLIIALIVLIVRTRRVA